MAKSVRTYFGGNLRNALNTDKKFRAALEVARRSYDNYLSDESGETKAKRCRREGAGRKQKAPEIREELFQFFVDIRCCFKGRLPKSLLLLKARELYANYLRQNPEPDPEKQLKFSNHWLRDWMKEYGVSLRKPNKRFAVSQMDREERVFEYLANIYKVRHFFKEVYKVDIPIINGDQESALHMFLQIMNLQILNWYYFFKNW